MRRLRVTLIVLMAVLALALCAQDSYGAEYKETTAFGKLGRGLVNVVTSPVEIPRNMYVESQYENVFYGMTVGLGKGLMRTVMRMGAGVVETLTFPFNFPDEFKDPIVEPEYAWQEWD